MIPTPDHITDTAEDVFAPNSVPDFVGFLRLELQNEEVEFFLEFASNLFWSTLCYQLFLGPWPVQLLLRWLLVYSSMKFVPSKNDFDHKILNIVSSSGAANLTLTTSCQAHCSLDNARKDVQLQKESPHFSNHF